MGEIIFWTIIRTALMIPIIWLAQGYMDYSLWWTSSLLVIYGVVVHPTIVQYQHFKEANKEVIEFTLCSSCKSFDESAVLCLKHDEHPTKDYLPCNGVNWEPRSEKIKIES
jgi:hypothetical protein